MSNPSLSVIIPICNSERYLDECLASVCGQDYRDIEIICVDDGSTDSSAQVLKAWSDKDERIRVVSNPNGRGPSAARNVGLWIAQGDYVTFVDSDDILCEGAYSFALQSIEQEGAEALGFSYATFPNPESVSFGFTTGRVVSFKELLSTSRRVESSTDLCFVWRYIFKRSLLDKNAITFREDICVGEDRIFITEALAASQRILLTDKVLYQYRVDNENSLMRREHNPHLLDSLSLGYEAKKEQISRFGMDGYSPCSKDLAEYVIKAYIPMLLSSGKFSVKYILSLPMVRESCNEVGLRNIYTTWKEYIFYLAVKYNCHRIVSFLYY